MLKSFLSVPVTVTDRERSYIQSLHQLCHHSIFSYHFVTLLKTNLRASLHVYLQKKMIYKLLQIIRRSRSPSSTQPVKRWWWRRAVAQEGHGECRGQAGEETFSDTKELPKEAVRWRGLTGSWLSCWVCCWSSSVAGSRDKIWTAVQLMVKLWKGV